MCVWDPFVETAARRPNRGSRLLLPARRFAGKQPRVLSRSGAFLTSRVPAEPHGPAVSRGPPGRLRTETLPTEADVPARPGKKNPPQVSTHLCVRAPQRGQAARIPRCPATHLGPQPRGRFRADRQFPHSLLLERRVGRWHQEGAERSHLLRRETRAGRALPGKEGEMPDQRPAA